jgi:septum formation topological specificity factor MinE
MPELLEALAQARARLHLMGGKDRSAELQTLSKSELATLRKEILALQTDLRAELRRRGPV